VVFDGTDPVFESDETKYFTTFNQHYTAAKSQDPYFNLSLDASATATTGNVHLKIVAADTLPVDSFVAFVGICQNDTPGVLKNFNYVCQHLLSFPVDLVYPDSLDTTLTFNHSIPVDKMDAVAFVQGTSTQKVMQAITKNFEEAK